MWGFLKPMEAASQWYEVLICNPDLARWKSGVKLRLTTVGLQSQLLHFKNMKRSVGTVCNALAGRVWLCWFRGSAGNELMRQSYEHFWAISFFKLWLFDRPIGLKYDVNGCKTCFHAIIPVVISDFAATHFQKFLDVSALLDGRLGNQLRRFFLSNLRSGVTIRTCTE